jgi:hypothetical protein
MGTRKRRERQEQLWVTHTELANGPGHPFYAQLNSLLDREKFDEFAEAQCAKFYAEKNGRPSLAPRTYFRLLLIEIWCKGLHPPPDAAGRVLARSAVQPHARTRVDTANTNGLRSRSLRPNIVDL